MERQQSALFANFFFRFSVDSMLNIGKKMQFPGAAHDDDTLACYLFK